MKNNVFKFLVLSIFAFIVSPLVAQPPPPVTAPANIATLGQITAVPLIAENQNFTWSIQNNTSCTAEFLNWFRIHYYEQYGNDYFTPLDKEASGTNTPIVLPPGAGGGVTNFQLALAWGLGSGYSVITANGVYLKIAGMTGFTELYPANSGSKISTGLPYPCNCIQYFFEPTTSPVGFRIRLENAMCP